jgi:hypothetical protein
MRLFLSSARIGTAWQIAADGIKLESDFDRFRIDHYAHFNATLAVRPTFHRICDMVRHLATQPPTGSRITLHWAATLRRLSRPR